MKNLDDIINFNDINYIVINKRVIDNITYYLVSNYNKIKILYEYENELYQLIDNSDAKKIIYELYSSVF